jgi:predicted alpha/beta hydrolase family esterase
VTFFLPRPWADEIRATVRAQQRALVLLAVVCGAVLAAHWCVVARTQAHSEAQRPIYGWEWGK